MGRYTGPKGRINRRLGAQIFENAGAIKALDKRDFPPGMHGRRRKVSNFGVGLAEKQKIKYYYGLRERQLRRYFELARKIRGNTGELLMVICERRLDNVVRRAGYTLTRLQARQGIVHRHFQLNGRTVDIPSILVRAGDVVTVRNRPNLQEYYKNVVEAGSSPTADWIDFEPGNLKATVTSIPGFDDVSLKVDVGSVTTFLSR
jgi:small subunit ribosomal protein S4